jgi:hypothetical protein
MLKISEGLLGGFDVPLNEKIFIKKKTVIVGDIF